MEEPTSLNEAARARRAVRAAIDKVGDLDDEPSDPEQGRAWGERLLTTAEALLEGKADRELLAEALTVILEERTRLAVEGTDLADRQALVLRTTMELARSRGWRDQGPATEFLTEEELRELCQDVGLMAHEYPFEEEG